MTGTRSFLRGSTAFHSNQLLFRGGTAGELDMTCFVLLDVPLISQPTGYTVVAGGPLRHSC